MSMTEENVSTAVPLRLATIEKINKIEKHPDADNVEIAHVLDYQSVVGKGTHKEGDLVVFIRTDSIVPKENPYFAWLEKHKFRVKPTKIRGVLSEGVVVAIEEFSGIRGYGFIEEHQDVTEVCGVTKYEKPAPACNEAKGTFPRDLLPVTDEPALKSTPRLFNHIINKPVYITLKYDGTSGTVLRKNGEFRVCSRKMELKYDKNNVYWKMVNQYALDVMVAENQAIQFEIYGEGIQKNPMKIPGQQIAVFNLWDLEKQTLLGHKELDTWCVNSYVPMVHDLYRTKGGFVHSKEWLYDYATGIEYSDGAPAEGIVVRPTEPIYDLRTRKYVSFKIINPNYKD